MVGIICPPGMVEKTGGAKAPPPSPPACDSPAFILIYWRTQITIQKAKSAVFPMGNQNPYVLKNPAVFYFCQYKLLIFMTRTDVIRILQNMQPLFWSKNQMSGKFLIVVGWQDVFRILQEFLSNERGIGMEFIMNIDHNSIQESLTGNQYCDKKSDGRGILDSCH